MINRKKTQVGMSLFELLGTISILGTVISVGVPSMVNAIEKKRLTNVAEAVYSNVQLARSESIARSQPVFMNIADGGNWAIGVAAEATCDPTDNIPACALPDMENNNPITHRMTFTDFNGVSMSTTANQVSFLPQRGTASGATIDITSQGNNGYIMRVTVGVLGQVSLCSPDADPIRYVSGYRPCS